MKIEMGKTYFMKTHLERDGTLSKTATEVVPVQVGLSDGMCICRSIYGFHVCSSEGVYLSTPNVGGNDGRLDLIERPSPVPGYVLWDRKNVPNGLFRRRGEDIWWKLDEVLDFYVLLRDYEYSMDGGGTWKPCGRKVQE